MSQTVVARGHKWKLMLVKAFTVNDFARFAE